MQFNTSDTALVVIDPQNDVMSEKGISWGLVGASVKENNTVENLTRLFQTAKKNGFGVFISPHYLYPSDQGWQFGGAVETMMLEGREFLSPEPAQRRGIHWFRGRLAWALQSLYRRRQDSRGEPAQNVGASNQRSRLSTSQAPHHQGDSRGDAGEPLRRKPCSRIVGAGLRGCHCERRHRGASASGYR